MVTIALMPHTSKAPPKPQLRKLGRRLREIRGRRKQDEIARPIGISAGYVSNADTTPSKIRYRLAYTNATPQPASSVEDSLCVFSCRYVLRVLVRHVP